jgi:AcrR family transcriptional regulator
MAPTDHASAPRRPRRRADAERSIERILDAAVDAFASDPEASMTEIARRAGLVRATIYVHFPTRDALIDAVTQRAIAEATATINAAEPERGDAADALRRVVVSAWAHARALATPSSRSTPSFHKPNCTQDTAPS